MEGSDPAAAARKPRVGFVLDYIPDLRVVSKEAILSRDSYTDRWLQSLHSEGVEGTKYVPFRGIRETETHRHRFGHTVKLVPVVHTLIPSSSSSRSTLSQRLEMLGFSLNLRTELRKDQTQVVHYANYFSSSFVFSPLAAGSATSVAWWTGGDVPRTFVSKWGWYLALRPALRRAGGLLIGDYPGRRETLTWLLNADTKKIQPFELIRVNQELFRPQDKTEARARLGRPSSSIELLSVISIIPLPNNDPNDRQPYLMLRTFAEAVKSLPANPKVFMNVVGTGVGLEPLKSLAAELGIAENVRFLGRIEHDELPWHYASADIVFLPYVVEKLNETNVLAEAFSCARTAVAFRRPGSDFEPRGGFLVKTTQGERGPELAGILSRQSMLAEKSREAYSLREQFSVATAGRDLLAAYSQIADS